MGQSVDYDNTLEYINLVFTIIQSKVDSKNNVNALSTFFKPIIRLDVFYFSAIIRLPFPSYFWKDGILYLPSDNYTLSPYYTTLNNIKIKQNLSKIFLQYYSNKFRVNNNRMKQTSEGIENFFSWNILKESMDNKDDITLVVGIFILHCYNLDVQQELIVEDQQDLLHKFDKINEDERVVGAMRMIEAVVGYGVTERALFLLYSENTGRAVELYSIYDAFEKVRYTVVFYFSFFYFLIIPILYS